MTTIKFTRPDGEARLEWRPDQTADGGFVEIELSYPGAFDTWFRYRGKPEELYLNNCVQDADKRREILLAAESLRNEKRALAENEFRDYDGDIVAFSEPTIDGYTFHWVGLRQEKPRVTFAEPNEWGVVGAEAEWRHHQALKWHRAAFLPILPDDYAYPDGELPRRMTDDEVRFPDGSAHPMAMRNSHVRLGSEWKWRPAWTVRTSPTTRQTTLPSSHASKPSGMRISRRKRS